MRFKNASEAIERLLDGYDIRLRPDFAGKAVVDECGVLGSCKIYYDNTENLCNICNEVIGKPLRKTKKTLFEVSSLPILNYALILCVTNSMYKTSFYLPC